MLHLFSPLKNRLKNTAISILDEKTPPKTVNNRDNRKGEIFKNLGRPTAVIDKY